MTTATRRDPLQLIGSIGAPSQWADLASATMPLLRLAEAPIVLPDGVTLDPAAAELVRDGHKAPGSGLEKGRALPVGTLVWARHAGRWRHGVVDGTPGKTSHPSGPTGGKVSTVAVIYMADRTGRLDRHRWPVSELRLRGVTS